MIKNKKCLEYYFDSRIYDKEEIKKNIEATKKEFPKKEFEVDIQLNEWGVYIITFYFEDKKRKRNKAENLYIVENNSKKQKQDRKQKYYGAKKYGQYKSTGIYRPY